MLQTKVRFGKKKNKMDNSYNTERDKEDDTGIGKMAISLETVGHRGL